MEKDKNTKIRIGVIGAGMMGDHHIRVLINECSELFEVTAFCDLHPPFQERAQKNLPNAVFFDDGVKLASSDLIDAVMISTPNATHKDLAMASLNSGKHVFSEKPVATTFEDVDELIKVSAESDLIYMIGHELRYGRYYQLVKELIEQGEIGEIRSGWCQEFRGPFLKKVDDWMQDDRRSGGAITDKNCHHFDLMNWWVGSKSTKVFAMGAKDVVEVIGTENEIIDNASIVYEYANGVRGMLQLCMFGAPDPSEGELRMGVIGEKGQMELKVVSRKIMVNFRDEKESLQLTVPGNSEKWFGHDGFVEEHEAFAHAILTGEAPLTRIENCADGTRIAIAAEQSIKSGAVEEL